MPCSHNRSGRLRVRFHKSLIRICFQAYSPMLIGTASSSPHLPWELVTGRGKGRSGKKRSGTSIASDGAASPCGCCRLHAPTSCADERPHADLDACSRRGERRVRARIGNGRASGGAEHRSRRVAAPQRAGAGRVQEAAILEPLDARMLPRRGVANVLSIGFVVRKCFQCSAGKS